MSRAFYSDYVNHCLRFYARHPNPKFKSDTDRSNWEACDSALKRFSESDRELLMEIFREGDTIPDNVFHMAKTQCVKQETIWKLVSELERKVAKRRGLL